MTAGLSAAGLTIKTLAELKDEIEAAQRGAIDPQLDTSAESPVGQLNASVLPQLAQVWELLEVVYNVRDPRKAQYAALDAVSAITGTQRRGATKGRVVLKLTVAASTTIAAGVVAQVVNQPDNRWVTLEDAVNGAGSPAFVTVQAEAQSAGRYVANAGTITVIATPATGWTAVTNDEDAAEGSPIEGDPALRVRREDELSGEGTSPVEAIRTDLLAVANIRGEGVVTACTVDENVSAYTDAIGRPPHSIEAVVQFVSGLSGAALADARQRMAAQLWKSKAGGISTWSDPLNPHSTTVVDSQSVARTVRWSEPLQVQVHVTVTLTRDVASYVGDAAVKDAAVAFGAKLRLGGDVIRSKLEAALVNLEGVLDVVDLVIGTAAAVQRPQNITIGPRELAAFDTSRVTVVVL